MSRSQVTTAVQISPLTRISHNTIQVRVPHNMQIPMVHDPWHSTDGSCSAVEAHLSEPHLIESPDYPDLPLWVSIFDGRWSIMDFQALHSCTAAAAAQPACPTDTRLGLLAGQLRSNQNGCLIVNMSFVVHLQSTI